MTTTTSKLTPPVSVDPRRIEALRGDFSTIISESTQLAQLMATPVRGQRGLSEKTRQRLIEAESSIVSIRSAAEHADSIARDGGLPDYVDMAARTMRSGAGTLGYHHGFVEALLELNRAPANSYWQNDVSRVTGEMVLTARMAVQLLPAPKA